MGHAMHIMPWASSCRIIGLLSSVTYQALPDVIELVLAVPSDVECSIVSIYKGADGILLGKRYDKFIAEYDLCLACLVKFL